MIPCDFIAPINTHNPVRGGVHHEVLLANFLAQTESLMVGKTIEEVYEEMEAESVPVDRIVKLAPHKVLNGNHPSSAILLPRVTPFTLGALMGRNHLGLGWLWIGQWFPRANRSVFDVWNAENLQSFSFYIVFLEQLFSGRSRTPTLFLKVCWNLILHILAYKKTILRKKNFCEQKYSAAKFNKKVFGWFIYQNVRIEL